jgi:hypothetical protein
MKRQFPVSSFRFPEKQKPDSALDRAFTGNWKLETGNRFSGGRA